MMGDRILITGGCGFIGTNLISYLHENHDATIVVLDNESIGTYSSIEKYGCEFVRGDIRDDDLRRQALEGVDIVVHLAADTGVIDSVNDPEKGFEVNVGATFRMLDDVRKAGIKRFINASTGGAILGEVPPPINEGMLPCPISPYGASKLAAEAYCSAFSGSYDMIATSLRFSNVYGIYSYHKGSVVAHFFKQILRGESLVVYGDGTQTRDYIFSRDLCDGIVRAIECGGAGVYQLGTGEGTTLNTLIEEIKAIVEPEFMFDVIYKNFRTGEIKNTYCDIRKAKKELGFLPKISLRAGLEETWEWFLKNKNIFKE